MSKIQIDESKSTVIISPIFIKDLTHRHQEIRTVSQEVVCDQTKKLIEEHKYEMIEYFIEHFETNFIKNSSQSHRRGGLQAISGIQLEICKHQFDKCAHQCDKILNIIFSLVSDLDVKIKFIACEALFNVLKHSNQNIILDNFNSIYAKLLAIHNETDWDVIKCSKMLDNLLKQVIIEDDTIDNDVFYDLFIEQLHCSSSKAVLLNLTQFQNLEQRIDSYVFTKSIKVLPPLLKQFENQNDEELCCLAKEFITKTYLESMTRQFKDYQSRWSENIDLSQLIILLVSQDYINGLQFQISRAIIFEILKHHKLTHLIILQNLSKLINFVNKLCDLNVQEFYDKNNTDQDKNSRTRSYKNITELIELTEKQLLWEDLQSQLDTIVKLYGNELDDEGVSVILQEILPINVSSNNESQSTFNILSWFYTLTTLHFKSNHSDDQTTSQTLNTTHLFISNANGYQNTHVLTVLSTNQKVLNFICQQIFGQSSNDQQPREEQLKFIEVFLILTKHGHCKTLVQGIIRVLKEKYKLFKSDGYHIITSLIEQLDNYTEVFVDTLAKVAEETDCEEFSIFHKLAIIIESQLLSKDNHNIQLHPLRTDKAKTQSLIYHVNNDQEIFKKLFQIMAFCPSSLPTLCLLSKRYSLAYKILQLRRIYNFDMHEIKILNNLASQISNNLIFSFIKEDATQKNINYDLINVIKLIMQILPQGNNFTLLQKFSKDLKKSIENRDVILGNKNELDQLELHCQNLQELKIKKYLANSREIKIDYSMINK